MEDIRALGIDPVVDLYDAVGRILRAFQSLDMDEPLDTVG